MPKRPCLTCGNLTDGASYCARHKRSGGTGAHAWRRLRTQTLQRDGHTCTRCGSREDLAVHHVVERAAGGPDALWNLETTCGPCHRAEHAELGW
jgi:5-methylcytosine-specific restriction endonuclease McrA